MHFAAALIVTGGQDKTILVHSTEQGVEGMFVCYAVNTVLLWCMFSLVMYYVILCCWLQVAEIQQ